MLVSHEDVRFLGNVFMEMRAGAGISGVLGWVRVEVEVRVRVRGSEGFKLLFPIFLCFMDEFRIFCFRIVLGVRVVRLL